MNDKKDSHQQPAPSVSDQFCDGHCTWRDHHPDCVRASDLPIPGEIGSKLVDGASGEGPTVLAWTDGKTAWLTHAGLALGPCTVALVDADEISRRLTTTGQGDVERLVEAARGAHALAGCVRAVDAYSREELIVFAQNTERNLAEALRPFGQQQEGHE